MKASIVVIDGEEIMELGSIMGGDINDCGIACFRHSGESPLAST
jgi:hypothetical protein